MNVMHVKDEKNASEKKNKWIFQQREKKKPNRTLHIAQNNQLNGEKRANRKDEKKMEFNLSIGHSLCCAECIHAYTYN